MDLGRNAPQSKEIAAIYDEAHRIRREAMNAMFRSVFSAVRSVFAWRPAH